MADIIGAMCKHSALKEFTTPGQPHPTSRLPRDCEFTECTALAHCTIDICYRFMYAAAMANFTKTTTLIIDFWVHCR